MLRFTPSFLVMKKIGVGSALAGAGAQGTSNKLASDEKFALAAVEYLYEWNPPNDGANKRAKDVAAEKKAAEAYDRYNHLADACFAHRTDRLVARMNAALAACPDELLEEATLFNSRAPPLGFRLPKQSPPVAGFEPAFGLDVPQLRLGQVEDAPLERLTDHMQLEAVYANEAQLSSERLNRGGTGGGGGGGKSSSSGGLFDDDDNNNNSDKNDNNNLEPPANSYPFVDAPEVRKVLKDASDKLEELHGAMRSAVPLTGTSGEEWETHCALQRRAFARQKLILDLSENAELYEKYNSEPGFAERELERRGILPLEVEEAPVEFDLEVVVGQDASSSATKRILPRPLPEIHYAQLPKYHPFRSD
jgi:hypothetical protein